MLQTNGLRTISHQLSRSAIEFLKQEWKHFERQIDDYPNTFSGRGIVMCAGGIKYFTCAWITINMLRRLGCNLPIEVWYKDQELTDSCIESLKSLNVIFKNFSTYKITKMHGWQLKPFSIIHSSFEEVLFIDADNIPLKNPEGLFEMTGYKETGTVFWPDFWETPKENPMWDIVNVPYRKTKEQESGQILIDKKRCWKSLNLASYFNKEAQVYYKILLGDKDTFRFSWLALGKPFFMIQKEPSSCGYVNNNNQFMGNTMLQYDENYNPFFLHRNLLKWDVTYVDERVWFKVKKFSENTLDKKYLNRYSATDKMHYMDIEGDCVIMDFREEFGNIEDVCLDFLKDLRGSIFYKDFILGNYINERRGM